MSLGGISSKPKFTDVFVQRPVMAVVFGDERDRLAE